VLGCGVRMMLWVRRSCLFCGITVCEFVGGEWGFTVGVGLCLRYVGVFYLVMCIFHVFFML